jgi:hypothetical protein
MVRIREIDDPELRERVRAFLTRERGVSIPDWFELDDADYVDVLHALRESDADEDNDDLDLDEPRD